MKKFLIAFLILATSLVSAQTRTGGGGSGSGAGIASYTVATLPAAANGTVAVVTDGLSNQDCTVGGGAGSVVCLRSGGAWVAMVVQGATSISTGTAPTACGSATGIWCATAADVLGSNVAGQYYIRAGLTGTKYIFNYGSGEVPLNVASGGTGLGSGTSGGVLGFTAAGTLASSGALTSNVLVKGGGAGATPTNSLWTDDGTTATYTGTGGAKAPAFTSTGTTAGFADFPQGATSASTAPCNTANSICEQAPAAVTAYVINKPGTKPTNNNSAALYSNATPGVGGWAKMPQTAWLTGSAYTNATTTFSNITGLSFSVEASTNYIVLCYILWQGSASTTGPKFQWTGPASPTSIASSMTSAVTATTDMYASATAFSSAMANTGTITTATNFPAELWMGLLNGANAGTIQLQAAANGAGTLTIQPGSYCVIQ